MLVFQQHSDQRVQPVAVLGQVQQVNVAVRACKTLRQTQLKEHVFATVVIHLIHRVQRQYVNQTPQRQIHNVNVV